MNDKIAEILLEKHYFSAIAKHLNKTYCPPGGVLRFKKISFHNNREQWYGFDQGFVYTAESHATIEEKIRNAIIPHHSKVIPSLQIAFFFQFKVVRERYHPLALQAAVKKISPTFLSGYPYFLLDMKKNKTTKLSQHKTLFQLSKVKNAHAFYALPLVFGRDEIDSDDVPSLEKLATVSLKTAPSSWVNEESGHFIAFRNRSGDDPYWCSDPERAATASADRLFSLDEVNAIRLPISRESLFQLIADCVSQLNPERKEYTDNQTEQLVRDAARYLPTSFHIIQMFEGPFSGLK
jgi:hypothetical protein